MASSTLHAIAVAELKHTQPAFYDEYCELVQKISELIRDLADQHAESLGFTSFTETFDRASNEPVLQIVIGANKKELYLHVYIHKDHHFVIGKSGSGQTANTAKQAIEIIQDKLREIC